MSFRSKRVIICMTAVAVIAVYWIARNTDVVASFQTPEGAARLALLTGPTECPARVEGGTLVGGCNHRPFPKAPNLSGSIDILGWSAGTLTVAGWAGNTVSLRPAHAVLIVIDDQARLWVPVGADRPDLGTYFGRESMRRSGYVLRVPAEQSETMSQRLRVFAIGPAGAVAELRSGAHTRRE